MGLGLTGVAVVDAGIAAVWTAVAVFLGRQYDRAVGGPAPAEHREETLPDAKRADL